MKPFKKIAIAALAASVAGTALTAGLPAFAQSGTASGDGGQKIQQAQGQQMAHKDERRGWAGDMVAVATKSAPSACSSASIPTRMA